MAQYVQVITVQGRGGFPIDMLRYDHCHPDSEMDSGTIAVSFGRYSNTYNETFTVKVRRIVENKSSYPTEGRWNSFGWKVLNVETRKR